MTQHNRRQENNNSVNSNARHSHKINLLCQLHHDDDHQLPVPSLPPAIACLVIVTIATLCYGNSYSAGFVFDDSEAILGNRDLKTETPISDLFVHDFWGSLLTSNTSHKSYRPLTVLTFRLNYYLAGGLNPCGFHVTNIILHALVCCLLLPVFTIILGVRGEGQHKGHIDKAALLCVLLFAVHPVHSESVAGVVGRADLLCGITFILSFLSYYAATHGNHIHSGIFGCDVRFLSLSMVLCVVSTFCKEMGITVLGVCCVYDLLMVSQIDPLVVLLIRRPDPKTHPVSTAVILRVLIMAMTGVGILCIRWRVQGSSSPIFQVIDNPHSFVNSTLFRFINYNYIYSLNSFILLNPCWLCFDWSVGCVPVIESLLDGRILAVAAFWCVSGSVIGYCLKQVPSKDQRSLTMALAFLVIPFLPATNLFFRVGFVVAERVLYLPSIGFIMLLVIGLRKLSVRTSHMYQPLLQWLIMVMLIVFGVRSYRRSLDWQNEQRLFESGELVCPLNAKVHYNIAKIHSDMGNISFAIEKYRYSISLHPEYDQAMNNLGNILKEQGELVEAEKLLLEATSIRPDFAAAWMNLAIVQVSLNQTESAEKNYYEALKHRRKYPDCYYNLGNMYLSEKRYAAALSAWRNATLQKPNHASAWSNMIILLDNLGRLDDIEVAVMEASRHLPEDPGIYYNYANALGKDSRFSEAEKYFLKAIQYGSNNPAYYSNLAVLYHRWGQLDKAEQLYAKALEMDPSSHILQANYALLLKKLSKSS